MDLLNLPHSSGSGLALCPLCPASSLALCPQQDHRLSWAEDGDAAELLQHEQVVVARDDEVGLCGDGEGQHIASFAQARGALYCPVCLDISAEELAQRVMSPARATQFKEMDAQAALLKASTRRVYRPPNHKVLDITVTRLTAEQAADQIARMLRAMV